jgi:Lysine-specific metallo-endopeptidase
MDRFSEAYTKAREVLNKRKYTEDWQKFLTSNINPVLGADAPDYQKATALDTFRTKLAGAAKDGKTGAAAADGVAATIVQAAKVDETDFPARAATLKLLKHLYWVRKRGAQDVWVYAPPKAYQKWVYEEIEGTEAQVKTKLKEETEVYSDDERNTMCDALQLALKWTQDAFRKLGEGSEETKKLVKEWFADEDTTDEQITAALTTLKEGYKKIAGVCNSNTLILSDEPRDRNKGGWKDWAFVYKSERMDVLYIQGAFLKSGSSGRLWMCALTIIHEISHRAVGTDDNRYDTDGIKPSKGTLSHAKALNNADTWGYFAADLAGALSVTDRTKVLKAA